MENGKPKGLGVDYINLINKYLQNKLTIVPDTFKNNLEKVKQGSIDIMIDITPNESRKKYYSFTTPYVDIPHYILTRKNTPNEFNKIEDIKGKIV